MLIDEPVVRKVLFQIVFRMEADPHSRQDLMQEALLHLWIAEQQNPGQELSWYLQSCKFHLAHYRLSGRSLDSPKHHAAQAAFPNDCDRLGAWSDALEFDPGIVSE